MCSLNKHIYQYVHLFFGYFWFFQDRVSLYSPGCPGTHSVDQAGLELRNPPTSASRVLGLKACATTTRLYMTKFEGGWKEKEEEEGRKRAHREVGVTL